MPDKPAYEKTASILLPPGHSALRTALIYAGISVLWILFSDQLLSTLVKDSETITWMQMIKGWFFVLATSCLIFFLLHNDIKKHRRVVDALRHSEEQLKTFMNAMPTAISWADGQGKVQYSNNKFRELFGYSLQEMPTVDHWFQLAYPDPVYRQQVVSIWQNAMEKAPNNDSEMTPVEVNITCKDGSIRNVAVVGTLLQNQILVVFNDLTESRQAEKALEESEKRYRALFESANDAILIIEDARFIECNQKTLDLFDSTQDQILGQYPYELSPQHQPDGSNSTELALEKMKSALAGEPQIFEWQHQRPNGEVFDVEVSLNLIEIESRKYIQAMLRDITERLRLYKEVQLMQLWIEQSDDFFFWVGDDSSILYVNQAVCQSLGYTKEEFRTMKVGDFDLEITLEAWPGFTQYLRDHGSYRFESRLQKKDGQVFPVEITANILKFEGKDHFFAYGRDVSAKVTAEEKRRELENRLRQAQKMEAIGTLAGGIAHDFNNILSPILIHSEMVMMDLPPDSRLQENIHEIHKAADRAKNLVKQILTFGRQKDEDRAPIQISLVLKEVLKLIRSSIPATIEIRQKIHTASDTVLADPTQIHQIVMNLCTNAADAMRETGGMLEVRLTDEALDLEAATEFQNLSPGRYAKISVRDTGHGIEPEHLERIFEPYFTTKGLGKGTGLGLAVVHGIAARYGGEITVESELKIGTTFSVWLPLVASQTQPSSEKKQKIHGGTEHILLVDDQQEMVAALQMMLEKLGYTVTARTSSLEALDIFSNDPDAFDLMITDMTMPKLKGSELSEKILKIRPDLPIILSTGFSDQIDEQSARAIGIRKFALKPIDINMLADVIRELLDQNEA